MQKPLNIYLLGIEITHHISNKSSSINTIKFHNGLTTSKIISLLWVKIKFKLLYSKKKYYSKTSHNSKLDCENIMLFCYSNFVGEASFSIQFL